MRSQPSPPRSRTRGQRTATGPMLVMISRSGRCPWRTNRRRPSSVRLSAWQLSKLETSASTAGARSARAPVRKTSVSGSAKVSGCESWKTLVSVTAYHSFAGEVEASSTPTIRRLTLSRRHQLSPIAPRLLLWEAIPPHPSFSPVWILSLASLFLLFRIVVLLTRDRAIAYAIVGLYIVSVGFMSHFAQLLHAAKPLVCFFMIASIYCALRLVELGPKA